MIFSDARQMVGCICLFFVCGFGVVAPLRSQIAFPTAASVFAGALALSSAVLTVHVATQMKFSSAIWIAAAGLIGLSAVMCRGGAFRILVGREFVTTAATLVVLVGAACFVYLGRESQFSSPALVFFAGSDQFGYAHMADWLNGAPGNVGEASPANPWDSWVHYMVTFDPRFGSISFVAIVSALTGRSGMFSYNLSCALVMVTASVGLAGIFSRSLTGFVNGRILWKNNRLPGFAVQRRNVLCACSQFGRSRYKAGGNRSGIGGRCERMFGLQRDRNGRHFAVDRWDVVDLVFDSWDALVREPLVKEPLVKEPKRNHRRHAGAKRCRDHFRRNGGKANVSPNGLA